MRGAAAAGHERRLRPRSRFLVHRGKFTSAVLQRAAEAGTGADDGEVAAGLPPSFDSSVSPDGAAATGDPDSAVDPMKTARAPGAIAAFKAPPDRTSHVARRRRSRSARRRNRQPPPQTP